MHRRTIDRRTLLVGLAASALAPATAATTAWPRVTALLDRYVSEGKVAGITVALRQAGAVQYLARGAQAVGGAPATETTLWRVFSMSKPITGVAAMKLIEARKLALDAPVADFVPEFANPKVLEGGATRPARTVMRVRHLLTHTAGLGYAINVGTPLASLYRDAGIHPGDPTPRPDGPDSLDAFGARLATLPLGADPGARYEYSVALDLLGLVIQRASGMAFEDYLDAALFGPLGMRDTGFFAKPESKSRLAMNYGVREGRLTPLEPPDRSPYWSRPVYPSGGGGVVSSAADYTRFCGMLMGEGALDGVRVLGPRTARLALSNLLPRGVLADDRMRFGAGMGIVTRPSADWPLPPGCAFWGGAAGTMMWVDQQRDFSAVLMTQFMPSRAWPIWREFAQAVYADAPA